jgi:hypothetical protein
MEDVLFAYNLKKEKEICMHKHIDQFILNAYMSKPSPYFQWHTPFKALYYYVTASREQQKIFKRAWQIIVEKKQSKPY